MRLPFQHAAGVPTQYRDRPNRGPTTAMRPWDWALPPRPVDLEVICAEPTGWADMPRGQRKPPLLFVPGMGGAAWTFAEHWLGAANRRGYPAYAMSLRGHGGSAGRDRLAFTTLRDYVFDVMQTVIGLPQPPVLIGHGMGALVVQLVLERYPAAAGVLVAPTPIDGITQRVQQRMLRNPLESTWSLLAGRIPQRPELMFYGIDDQTALTYLRRLDREAPLVLAQLARGHRIGPVYSPVAVVGCHADEVVAPTDVRLVADMYDVRPIWLPGAGHMVMLDGSHSVGLDIILDWVDERVVGAAGPASARKHAGR